MTRKPQDIFIVDDDPVFTEIAKVLFRRAGASDVHLVANSRESLVDAVSRSKRNSLLILNLKMGGLDGLAVMRILAEQGYKGWVAVSSGESASIRESASRLVRLLGLNDAGVLEKPVRESGIEALLESISHPVEKAPLPLLKKSAKIIGIKPVYQPKVDAVTEETIGAETLMRLETETGELLSPQSYLDKLNRDGTLGKVTLEFLDLILADMLAWKSEGHFPVISVNAPAPVLENPQFLINFAQKVRASGISPSQITIELTESVLPQDPATLVELLTRLRMAGFGLALDDFGTGMANFDMLRMCPFSELKIDRGLSQASINDPLSCGVIEMCATVSRELGMTLVAEGIETEVQEATLRRLGVSVFQGFLFGYGMPMREFGDRLKDEANVWQKRLLVG